MLAFPFPVNSEDYTATPGVDRLITTDLPGGLPRTELDFIGNFFNFQVSLEVNKKKYLELMALYGSYVRSPQPCQFNLASYGVVSPHLCYFVPDSFKLVKTDARDYFRVQFNLVGSKQ